MYRFSLIVTAIVATLFCSFSLHAASGLKNVELRDLYFGEVLYYAYQDLHFEALSRLDNELSQYYQLDESTLDTFHTHLGPAEFSIGDIELQYRMSQRAGRALQVVLGEGVDLAVRNMAALQLARVFYRKDDPQNALFALDLIREEPEKSRYDEKYTLDVLRGREPKTFKTDVAYLSALANISTGRFTEAVETLKTLRNKKRLEGYVLYNLAIALTLSGKEEEGLEVFDELGRMNTGKNDLLALRDKTNLKLAYQFLDKSDAKKAKNYFDRVRLDGPFSNHALLGSGWVSVADDQYDRALVPWSILHERDEINVSVQESLMAVPFAYGKLGAHGKAANLYNHAMGVFSKEIKSLDDSIKSIRKGRFIKALLDNETSRDENWVVNLRELTETPETRYTLELLASNDFQESYKNYKDLSALRGRIDQWLADLTTYEEIIELRRQYQEPILPVVEEKFKSLDGRINLRLEQRNNLAAKIKNLLISPRPEYLATADERQALDVISALDEIIATSPEMVDEDLARRNKRLRGILMWRVHSEYDQRLTDAYNNLIGLDEIIVVMKEKYNSFIRTRQAATQSYEGYTVPIRQLRTRLFSAQRKLKGITAKQGRLLETMAINELELRRNRLEEYQVKARFALAESYDRATKAKVDTEIERQKEVRKAAQEEKNLNEKELKEKDLKEQEINQQEKSGEEGSVSDEPQAERENTLSEVEASTDGSLNKDSKTFKDKLLRR